MSLNDDLEEHRSLNPRGRGIDDNAFQHFNFNARLSDANYLNNSASRSPEAIFKVTSFARGHRVRKLMEYVARTGKEEEIALEDETGVKMENKGDIGELYQQWAEDFERAKPGTGLTPEKQKRHEKRLADWEASGRKGPKPRAPKGPARHASHLIFHVMTNNDDKSARAVEDAARELLRDNFAKAGYEYAFAVHRDGKHPHVHVVMKNYNRELDKKLRIDKKDIFALRQSFAKKLQQRGIEQVATLRRDRPHVIENIVKGQETIKQRATWYQSKMGENKKAPGINVDTIQRQQTRKIHTIEKRITKAPISTPQKDKLKKSLKKLKINLMEQQGQSPERQVEATVRALGKDAKLVETGLKQVANIKKEKEPKKIDVKDKRATKNRLRDFATKLSGDLDNAVKFIKKSNIDRTKKNAALKQLRQMQKITRPLVRNRSR